MQLLLYQNSSESNRVDKTTFLKLIKTLTGTFRQQTSIVNPVVMIEVDYSELNQNNIEIVDDYGYDVDENESEVVFDSQFTFLGINYAYIPELKRYYFITDIVAVNDTLWELTMHCDVLMSFKDEIYNVDGYVSRNEFSYNKDLVDGQLQIQNNPSVVIYEIECDIFDAKEYSSNSYYYVATLMKA